MEVFIITKVQYVFSKGEGEKQFKLVQMSWEQKKIISAIKLLHYYDQLTYDIRFNESYKWSAKLGLNQYFLSEITVWMIK